jgi:ABC-type sugar transport system ATPase subunit
MHSYKKERRATEKFQEILKIKMSSPYVFASSLSGGNQQKVCLAKCLITEPDIIIFDEPTVGIDIKTKVEIHKLIYQLSMEGKSIILISSDMTELIQISDRVLVFNGGYIIGEMENKKDYDEMSKKIMQVIQKVDVSKKSHN